MMEYPNSGALFPARDKRHPKAPDFSGDIVMEVSLLKQLIAESDGDGVKLKISGWNREGRVLFYVVPMFTLELHNAGAIE